MVAAAPVRRLPSNAVAAAWLVAAALLVPQALGVEERLLVQARILGSESSSVEAALAQRFASPFAVTALLVVSGAPGPDRPEGRAILEETVAALSRTHGVRQTLSYLDHPDPLFVGSGGGTFVVVGLDPATAASTDWFRRSGPWRHTSRTPARIGTEPAPSLHGRGADQLRHLARQRL